MKGELYYVFTHDVLSSFGSLEAFLEITLRFLTQISFIL
nr:MAG TPA: hypothetical protein [Caudoviricetes sp.]